jgi:hypothetical protein
MSNLPTTYLGSLTSGYWPGTRDRLAHLGNLTSGYWPDIRDQLAFLTASPARWPSGCGQPLNNEIESLGTVVYGIRNDSYD